MAAPLGFKTFNTGDVLSAADTNGYLMQGIWVFADATARDAAVTSPQEGNSCYLKDTDVIQVYSGSSWVVKSGGSSPLTTKGDLYTYSTTDTRLPVGTNGHTLVADSAEATGLKWAAPAGASFKGCTAYKNGSNQSVSSETATVITYDAEEFDTDSFHSTSTNTSRFTIPAGLAGKYQIAVVAQISSNSTGYRQFNILKNGTAVSRNVAAAVNGLNTVANVVAVLDLAVADYVELMVYQNGGSLNADAGQTVQRFSLIYLGA